MTEVTDAELKRQMETVLNRERGGVSLTRALVDALAEYLVVDVKVEDVNDVLLTDLPDVLEEAWTKATGKKPPGLIANRLKKWVRNGSAPPVVNFSSGLSSGDDGDLNDVDNLGEEELAEVIGHKSPTPSILAKLRETCKGQRINGARLNGLSASLELGRVCEWADLVATSFAFGSLPALSELAKKQKKAGAATLTTILDGPLKDVRRDLSNHFSELIREFGRLRLVEEAMLISDFWAETQTVSNDDAILVAYLKAFFRKYPGVGLPTPLDVMLVTRVTGQRSAGGVSESQFNELKEKHRATKQEVGELKSEINRIKQELGRIKSAAGGGGGGNDALKNKKKDLSKVQCHLCEEFGHFARDCPHKEEKEEEKKKDE